MIDVLRYDADRAPELVSMRWGLIPSWWKKTVKDVPSTFNARAESVAEKPMFRSAFKRSRCIVPASGYYEWKTTPDGKQPYFITAAGGGVLSIVGLWDRWKNHSTFRKGRFGRGNTGQRCGGDTPTQYPKRLTARPFNRTRIGIHVHGSIFAVPGRRSEIRLVRSRHRSCPAGEVSMRVFGADEFRPLAQ
jgi:SOS response associated peptidase (SRAP)